MKNIYELLLDILVEGVEFAMDIICHIGVILVAIIIIALFATILSCTAYGIAYISAYISMKLF